MKYFNSSNRNKIIITKKTSRKPGFTIVELLIAIVVIGILAAISIVSYNGIQGRAQASVKEGSVASSNKQAELFRAENERYPIDSEIANFSLNEGSIVIPYGTAHLTTFDKTSVYMGSNPSW